MSGILQGIGQIKEGQIAAAQGELDEKISLQNQQALDRQAKAERDAASIEEGRIARKSKLVQARLAVGSAKSNIGLAGASLESLTEAAFQFSMDRNLTLRSGLLRSRELTQRGSIIAAEGKFAKKIGKQRRNAMFFKAAGSFASTIEAAASGGMTSGGGTPTTQPTQSLFNSNAGRPSVPGGGQFA